MKERVSGPHLGLQGVDQNYSQPNDICTIIAPYLVSKTLTSPLLPLRTRFNIKILQ